MRNESIVRTFNPPRIRGNPAAVREQTDCIHSWLIDPPCGATSHGRCKRCGAEKDFLNSLYDPVPRGLYWIDKEYGKGEG